ncbi:MAG TPA: TIGR02281 family clan AA aspartic protease [Methyloceanibacter sp.]|nr:TIGR02281 family clan AA aspartic protease [Methyloceanibacter sp.]
MSAWIAIFVLALAAMLLVSNSSGTIANIDSDTFGYVALGVALLVFIGGGVLVRYRGHAGAMFRDAITWIALGLALVTLYSYREELLPVAGRLAGEHIPGNVMVVEETPGGPVEVKLRKRLNGHFTANADVNGKSIPMIVDTGASTIVLRPEDAETAGIDVSRLSYTVPVLTANGRTVAARVRLDSVAIGPLQRKNVDALVAAPKALTESLLGMSFLGRLKSYEFSGDFLTLRG